MNASQKQYVGSGKTIGQYGNIKLNIRYSDLKPSEKGYVNLILSKRKEVDQFGNDYTITIDDWKPDPSKYQNNSPQPTKNISDTVVPLDNPTPDSDLPF